MHDLRVWPKIEADGEQMPTTTPGKSAGHEDHMGRLGKVQLQFNLLGLNDGNAVYWRHFTASYTEIVTEILQLMYIDQI